MNNLKGKIIAKKITAILLMPVFIYVLMALIGVARGVTFNIFNIDTIKSIIQNSAYMTLVALGIGFQLKYGRFDFSGGAIIVVSALITAKFIEATDCSLFVASLIAIVSGILLSLLNSLIYIGFRVPISVISLASAYLIESFTGLIAGTKSISQPNILTKYIRIGNMPLVLIPLLLGIAVYVIYGHFTVAGKQSKLLQSNQKAAVNIGINEKKNTIIAYIVSGFIFGLASIVYVSKNDVGVINHPLETAGTLFSNIVPSLVGLFLSRYIDDSTGTFVGALTIQILYYGLQIVGVGDGMKTVCYSIFLAVFIFVSGFWDQIWFYLRKWISMIKEKRKKQDTNIVNE